MTQRSAAAYREHRKAMRSMEARQRRLGALTAALDGLMEQYGDTAATRALIAHETDQAGARAHERLIASQLAEIRANETAEERETREAYERLMRS